MGLTIHYGLTSKTRSTAKARSLVERMRQLALDLPFESVDDQVRHLGPDVCQQPIDDLRQTTDCFLPCWTAASMSLSPGTANNPAASPSSRWKSFRSTGSWPRFGMGQLRPCPIPG